MEMRKDFADLPEIDKVQLYINHARPVLNKQALFADGTEFYRMYTPQEDGYGVRLRFRTERDNVETVTLVTNVMRKTMERVSVDRQFDYYETFVSYPACGQDYYFEVVSGKMQVVYNKRGVMDGPQNYYNFKFRPEFKTPDWAKGAVFYQIFVDRFFNGDPTNDVLDHEYSYIGSHASAEKDWMAYPKNMDVGHFYGGDLQGVMDKLDYLQDLGVEVLYLNPIFVSPSNHKYDIQDYDYIDPHYGKIVRDEGELLKNGDMDNRHATRYITRVTDKENLEASNAFFIKFVEEVHRRGMRVILDGVFNHCGSFNKWLDRERIYEGQSEYKAGAYVDEESPYHSFFKFHTEQWPYNKDYDGWWGHETLPKLNYEGSEKLYEYIIQIGKKWVSPPYNVDGWRLDVAADLGHSSEFNHQFWRDFRKAVKEANPDALILAENYSDPASWLDGDQWDTVMNYEAFMEPVTWFLTGVEKHSDEYRGDLLCNFDTFQGAMSHHMSRFHHESLYVAMNELSNHDHSRFLTRTNGQVGRLQSRGSRAAEKDVNPAVMRAAVIMQMTWPGAPTVYYGDEAGVCGWTDPDNRRTYPWGAEDMEMLRFHKEAIRIHRNSSALRTGSFKMLYGTRGILVYGRFDEKERYAVVVNNTKETVDVKVPVWQLGVTNTSRMEQVLMSVENAFTRENNTYAVKDGHVKIAMPRTSAVILREIRG
ncbi:MAG: glycoside hydrolase family 13 protein [Coprococcus sp.]